MTVDCDFDHVPLGVAVRSLNNMIARYIAATSTDQQKETTGVNAEIIVFLAKHEGKNIFPTDIERRFSTTRSTVCRVLGLMESKGLIERKPVEHDARCKAIVLTDKAKAIAESMRRHGEAMERMMLDGMDENEIAALRHGLNTMRANLIATGKIGGNVSDDAAKSGGQKLVE
ncbi:MarR family winged helix-turn-helix transcriptional regulator [Bifidobacterium oedipodis]|uniref:MarR family transcriptional regulator n=1 Tax=Bifidobacterium oedipodis TaxID=2675322 RepID=A0A7Y0EP04_9BIFI|nr:MarR family transcriptional regulator [Bifidobacterium sp. DSM 109957]NMM93818.1 MarR family transcriptional regulator [Bifidobacterium sp. DSM 109957]